MIITLYSVYTIQLLGQDYLLQAPFAQTLDMNCALFRINIHWVYLYHKLESSMKCKLLETFAIYEAQKCC